jgi:hypothetical protein
MLDVFFISIGEPSAEDNFNRLLQFAPKAKRVKDVVGIYEVHKACAQLSATKNFYVVDADAWILDNFNFDFIPNPEIEHWSHKETNCVLIWNSINPVNELVYGYGGVKLFPKAPFLENRKWYLDLSTTIGSAAVSMNEISCQTRFNTTPELAWIAGFRECAKLSSLNSTVGRWNRLVKEQADKLEDLEKYIQKQTNWTDEQKTRYRRGQKAIITDSYKETTNLYRYFGEIDINTQRYSKWTRIGWHNPNGNYTICGSQAGVKFGLKNAHNPIEMQKINDWDWLKKEFANSVTF